jgi:hypothetical protein
MRLLALAVALLASPAASAEDAREILDRVIAVAEAHGADRYAFTLVYRDMKESAGKPYSVRFDPRLPEGARWTLLTPKESELSKGEQKRFKTLMKANRADDGLVYDRLGEAAKNARLLSEDASTATFAGQIADKKTPKSVAEALEMTIVLDKRGGFVRKVAVVSKAPFKPSPVAKVERMSQTQTYEPAGPGGPALLNRSESIVAGEAMFKKFDEHVVMEYRNIEAAGIDAVPDKK